MFLSTVEAATGNECCTNVKKSHYNFAEFIKKQHYWNLCISKSEQPRNHRGILALFSSANESTLLRIPICVPMYACQLWCKHTQASIKRLRVAYSNAYRTLDYIPMNVSVHYHEFMNFIRIFVASIRNNLQCMPCFKDLHLYKTLFANFSYLMLFTYLHFYPIM